MPKCEYCDQKGVIQKRLAIDSEPGEDGLTHSVFGEVWLCKEHLLLEQERLGIFDVYKYGYE